MKNSFLLLFEEIMKSTVSVDTFEYRFVQDTFGDIKCEFETLNNSGELVQVVAKVSAMGKIEFSIKNNDITKDFDEKKFMLNFYKDYEKFKEALKKFVDSNNENKKNNENDNLISVDNKNIPTVQSFNSKLETVKEKIAGIPIEVNSDSFIFKNIEDNLKKLIEVTFDIINNTPENNEPSKYNVTAFIKLLNENSVTLKFILTDPENNDNKKELSESEFKTKFNSTYKNYKDALDKFEKLESR